jgi:hypothetical protein
MSDVWSGSQAEIESDPWMTWVPILLYVTGAAYVLLGLFAAVGLAFGAFAVSQAPTNGAQDTTPALVIFGVEGVVLLGICGVIGAINIAAGWGFGRGMKWAWFAALIIGAMYTPSACLPFGAALLYGCLNERTRNRFLATAAAAT